MSSVIVVVPGQSCVSQPNSTQLHRGGRLLHHHQGHDLDRAVSRSRPAEPAALKPLGVERHAGPVMPEDLDQAASSAAEDVEISRVRIPPERVLDVQGETFHPAPHVGAPDRDPHADAGRERDQRRRSSAPRTSRSATGLTSEPTRMRQPLGSSISIVS